MPTTDEEEHMPPAQNDPDGYYGDDDMGDDELDLSFLDQDDDHDHEK